MAEKGFIQSAEDKVVCRFRYKEIIVDVMNTKEIGWAPANPWFAPGFALRQLVDLGEQRIQILPLPFFLASKFTAYNQRGNSEPRASHDFEDIVYILDNHTNITGQIVNAAKDVKSFLQIEIAAILEDPCKQEAIYTNLSYVSRDERFAKIMDSFKQILLLK